MLKMDKIDLQKRSILKCRDFVRQFSYHRAMFPHIKNLRTNIWIYTFNNFIDMSILDWCHLFGNRNDDLYWKNVITNNDEFKRNILANLKISEKEWNNYWSLIKDYRDKHVAHIEISPQYTIPDLTNALESIKLYYSYVIKELHENNEYLELTGTLDRFIKEATIVAEYHVNTHVVNMFDYLDEM